MIIDVWIECPFFCWYRHRWAAVSRLSHNAMLQTHSALIKKAHQLLGLCETLCQSPQSKMVPILLDVCCHLFQNTSVRSRIHSHGRLRHDDNTASRSNCTTKIRPRAVRGGICDRLKKFDRCQLKVAGDVISSAAVDYIGMDFDIKFGDSKPSTGRIIWLFALCSI